MIPREELEAIQKRNRRRHRNIWLGILSGVLATILFLSLLNFTDLFYRVSEDIVSTTPAGEWTTFRHDMQHTGSVDPSGTVPQGQVAWRLDTGEAIHSSPAVVDGIVYFGSRNYHLYALNAVTGEVIWKYKTGSWVEASPIVTGGVVYCGSNDGNMYAFDAATGAKLWQYDAQYPVRGAAAYANGVIYFGGDNWNVHAVDAATGEEIWVYETNNLVISSPVVLDGIVAIGGVDGHFYCINARNGRGRLAFLVRSMVATSPVSQDGLVYFTNAGGNVYALDPKAKNWPLENTLRKYWDAMHIYGVAPRPPVSSGYIWNEWLGWGVDTTSSIALADNTMYFGAGNDVLSMDLETRETNWTFSTGDSTVSSPAVEGQAVYIGSYDGNLYAIDRSTGEQIWQISTDGRITSSPAVANGMVYVGSHDGVFYAIK
ncbi:MAG: PQQ-binding-like beta-propeller repeat protein [Dehalococcoidales bacterium]|nr:PQQ-binding-like beta-propeller repeat protein [Dehalococcoidales bacterium]